jgi:hypothetical protein
MARLKRNCHRLIWLNPLLGAPDYEPLTRGIQAALPTIDNGAQPGHFGRSGEAAGRPQWESSSCTGREKSLNTKATSDTMVENRFRVKILILGELVPIVVRINGGTHARYSA